MYAKVAAVLIAVLIMPACIMKSKAPGLSAAFDPSAAAYVIEKGTGRIEGQAFLAREVGGPITPASGEVLLMPVTPYQTARMNLMYANSKSKPFGVNEFTNNPSGFETYRRSTEADAEGRFTFTDVKAGSYYIIAPVSWTADGQETGAYVYDQVAVTEGSTTTVSLSGL